MQSAQRQGLFYIVLAVTGYACLPILVRLLQAGGMHPFDIATWRFFFAAPAIWLLIAALRRPAPARPLPRTRLLLLGLLLAVAALTAFFGLERLPAGMYILLFYTYPVMVALISVLLGERLPARGWAALGLALVGVVLTIPEFGAGLSADSWVGVLLALANALTVSVYFILNNRLMRGHDAMAQGAAWVITGSFVVMAGLALVRPVNTPPSTLFWVYLLALALVSTVVPVLALTVGLQKLGAARAAIASTFEPVLTLILAALILGETMLPAQLVGGALILVSITVLQVPIRRRAALRTGEVVASGD